MESISSMNTMHGAVKGKGNKSWIYRMGLVRRAVIYVMEGVSEWMSEGGRERARESTSQTDKQKIWLRVSIVLCK